MSSMYPQIDLLLNRTRRGLRRTDAMTSAKRNYLQPFAGRFQGYYDQAQAAERGVGQAVSQGLTQQGQQLGGSIAHALSGIQAPGAAIQQYGTGTATQGAQAGAAAGALSSADLQMLQGHSTAEQVYASALPRLAQLAGEQERRAIFAQSQEDLSDLSLQIAAENDEKARYEQESAYQRQQDALDRQRQTTQDRIERYRYRTETKRERNQAKAETKRQAYLDRIAAAAAAQEYGLDVADYNLDVQKEQSDQRKLTPASEATNRSSGFVMGYNSQGKLVPFKGSNGKPIPYVPKPPAPSRSGGSKDDPGAERKEYFYDVREQAFKRAREYATPSNKIQDPMSRAEAAKKLRAEFLSLLVGRGYDQKLVAGMIKLALDASY